MEGDTAPEDTISGDIQVSDLHVKLDPAAVDWQNAVGRSCTYESRPVTYEPCLESRPMEYEPCLESRPNEYEPCLESRPMEHEPCLESRPMNEGSGNLTRPCCVCL